MVQLGAESVILAGREVPHKAEEELGDVSPGRLEDEIQRGGIKRPVDAGRRGDFGLLPSDRVGARLGRLTPNSRTSYQSQSPPPQLRPEMNAKQRYVYFTLSHDVERRA